MFYLYQDVKGEWRWNYTINNNIIFCSSEGYKNKADALNAIRIAQSSCYSGVMEQVALPLIQPNLPTVAEEAPAKPKRSRPKKAEKVELTPPSSDVPVDEEMVAP